MTPDQPNSVVIVGGGFAGVEAARVLESGLPRDWDIFLLSRQNVLTYYPLLAEVVGGTLLPGHAAAPIRLELKRTRIRMVNVDHIDVAGRQVRYSGAKEGSLGYDHLAITVGTRPNLDSVPGLVEHSLPLKTIGDALQIRNSIIRRLEQATLTRDADERRRRVTFVVIGGGFSGVEVAGEINDLVASVRRYYKNVEPGEPRVLLVHGGSSLLPAISPKLGEYARSTLESRGIEIMLERHVRSVEAGRVNLEDGTSIDCGTIVSTIGTSPYPWLADSGLPTEAGRLRTDGDLRVQGHQDVWSAGDCAHVLNAHDGRTSPLTAQFAVAQGRHLGKNIVAAATGRSTEAFAYRPKGQLAAVGRRRAVAEVYGVRVRGLIGWFLWRALYLARIPTLTAKVRVYFEWTWAMLFPRDVGYLDFERTDREPDRDSHR